MPLATKADLERLRRLMEIAKNEVATWPAWKKGSPGNVRLDMSKNTTPPAPEKA